MSCRQDEQALNLWGNLQMIINDQDGPSAVSTPWDVKLASCTLRKSRTTHSLHLEGNPAILAGACNCTL